MDEQKNTPNGQNNGNGNGTWRKKKNRRRHHGNKNKNRPGAEEKINNVDVIDDAEEAVEAAEEKIDLSVIDAIEKVYEHIV